MPTGTLAWLGGVLILGSVSLQDPPPCQIAPHAGTSPCVPGDGGVHSILVRKIGKPVMW